MAVEQEIWRGFVFVRMAAGLPSVAEMMSPYDDEIASHGFEDLVPQGRVTMRRRDVKRGVATLCMGGGNGLALAIERP